MSETNELTKILKDYLMPVDPAILEERKRIILRDHPYYTDGEAGELAAFGTIRGQALKRLHDREHPEVRFFNHEHFQLMAKREKGIRKSAEKRCELVEGRYADAMRKAQRENPGKSVGEIIHLIDTADPGLAREKQLAIKFRTSRR